MKKLSIITVLFFGFCTASYAQLEKMKSAPAYDNVQKERILHNSHNHMEQALIDNTESTPAYNVIPDNMLTLSDNKQSGDLFKVQPTADYHGKYDIKKVTFPARKKLGY